MNEFFRFPHTPHIAWLGDGAPRDDKVLSPAEAQALLADEVVVEEKLDGANLGISVGPDRTLRVQNRGQYLAAPYRGQFDRLAKWLPTHEEALFDALDGHLILLASGAPLGTRSPTTACLIGSLCSTCMTIPRAASGARAAATRSLGVWG